MRENNTLSLLQEPPSPVAVTSIETDTQTRTQTQHRQTHRDRQRYRRRQRYNEVTDTYTEEVREIDVKGEKSVKERYIYTGNVANK